MRPGNAMSRVRLVLSIAGILAGATLLGGGGCGGGGGGGMNGGGSSLGATIQR